MNEGEIIKKFLDHRLQLEPKAVKFFHENQEKIEDFLNKIQNTTTPNTISLEFIKNFFGETTMIKILKTPIEIKEDYISPERIIEVFIQRYVVLKKFLDQRLDLINLLSINKITSKTKKFSIIVSVKEKNKDTKSIEVEDLTGKLNIFLNDNTNKYFDLILLDEVLALVCEREDNEIYAKKIIWPDLPLRKEIKKTEDDISCLFLSGFDFDSHDFKKQSYKKFLEWLKKHIHKKLILFLLDNFSDESKLNRILFQFPQKIYKVCFSQTIKNNYKNTTVLGNPSLLSIQDLIILITCGEFFKNYQEIWKKSTVETIQELLKKRHLNPTFRNSKDILFENNYIIDIVPDILVCGCTGDPGIINYKGTTIVSNGSFLDKPIFWMINLKTRESIKVDFT